MLSVSRKRFKFPALKNCTVGWNARKVPSDQRKIMNILAASVEKDGILLAAKLRNLSVSLDRDAIAIEAYLDGRRKYLDINRLGIFQGNAIDIDTKCAEIHAHLELLAFMAETLGLVEEEKD